MIVSFMILNNVSGNCSIIKLCICLQMSKLLAIRYKYKAPKAQKSMLPYFDENMPSPTTLLPQTCFVAIFVNSAAQLMKHKHPSPR
jgi:hypothetical protein